MTTEARKEYIKQYQVKKRLNENYTLSLAKVQINFNKLFPYWKQVNELRYLPVEESIVIHDVPPTEKQLMTNFDYGKSKGRLRYYIHHKASYINGEPETIGDMLQVQMK